MEEAPNQEPPQEDLSTRTVLVLVLLTLAVSFISAWVSISTADSMGVLAPAPTNNPISHAQVSLTVAEPNAEQATGRVVLEILPLPAG